MTEENLKFGIVFDLDAGVREAIKGGNKALDKIAKALADHPITVKVQLEQKERLAQQVRQQSQMAVSALSGLKKEMADLNRQWNSLTASERGGEAGAKLMAQYRALSEEAKGYMSTLNAAVRFEDRLARQREKSANTAARAAQKTREYSDELKNQDGYISRLLKRMAVYAGYSMVSGFLTSVREVTAQFELQRISLGAIIQDQERANALFSEIKSFALKSPVSILDMTKYTKQLAAYKIETDELFETTKKLTDVSVGLSVSLDRVILAYGQVRARGALYSSEIRQFTEMGVPIVEELAAKLTKMNGQLVTSAQVLKMVEKGAISFELVKEVFDDMTEAGGIFYNMQEKQGNTLFGLWQKLGDAASVMYDEIGSTSDINKGMKEGILLLTELMKNWRYFANGLMMAAPTMLLVHNIEKSRAAASARQIAATNTLTAATAKRIAAEKALNQAVASGLANTAAKARMNLILAQTEEKVAQKALTSGNSIGLLGKRFNVFGSALKNLSAFVATNFWTILLTGIALVTSALVSANEKANRLKNTLAEIGASGSLELGQSVQNFERLAKIAVESADGSKKQRDALEELHRTYKDMIPVQDMTIEKLRAMDGDYRKLTIAIEEYIRARMKQQQIDAVTSEIGADLAKFERKMTEDAKGFFYTYDKGSTKLKLTYDQIQLLIKGIKEIAKTERDLPTRKVFAKALTDYVGLDADNLEVGLDEWLNTFDDGLFGIVRSVRQFEGEIDRIKANETLDTTLGKYAESWKKVNERIENLTVKGAKVGSFTFDRATANASVKQYVGYLKEVLGDAWDESFASIEEHVGANGENMSAIYWEAVMRNWDSYTVAQQNAILKVQKSYDGLLPSDRTVVILREKLQQISGQFGVNMDITKQYLMNAGEDIEAYAKRVKISLEEAQNNLKELRFNKSQIEAGVGTGVLKPVSDEEIEKADNLTKVLSALFELISAFAKGNSGGGRQSDPRLQILNDIANKMAQINKEYDDLLKKEGQTKALADTQKLFASSFADMQKVADKYKFKLPAFEVPQTIEDVQKWYDAIIKEINRLGIKNADKILIELGFKRDKSAIDKQQREIESELKALADRISRTKTAKEFYEKILSQTGDVELATRVSLSIYGSTGEELAEQVKEQFRLAFATLDKPDVEVSAKIGDLIDKGRYEELRNYIALLPEAQRKAAEDLVKAQQQMSVKQYEQWLKDLEKAKDYADKRIELSRYTANQIAAIEERIAKLNPQAADYEQQKAMLEKLIAGYENREKKEAAGLEYEQFKNSALYVQVFENLDNASKTALENMRNRLLALKDQWKNLSPQQVKELTKRLEELDAQIAGRNPFKSIADSIKKLRDMRMGGRTKEGDAQKAFDAEADRQAAEAKMLADEKAYEAAVKQYGAESDIAKAKRKIADDSADAYRNAEQMADSATENADEWEEVAEAIDSANQKLDKYQEQINEALGGVRKIMESFGASAEDMQFFDDVTNGFNEIFDAGQQGAAAYADFMQGNFVGAATKGISAVGSLISGVTNLFYAGRVKRANKEIKRQQELLDQLEYTYGRLEKAADKVFGADFVANQKQQQKILLAQQQAYMKQYEAEMSKGKKADKEKAQEFLDKARDVGDQIADMQGKIAERMAGTDVASAARDFASAWLEAYASFGNTTDAIREKFNDMIKNMIVESVMAKTVQMALQPMFDEMDKMYKSGASMTDVLSYAFSKAGTLTDQISNGLEVNAKYLESLGINIRDLYASSDNLKGIAKEVGSASSEEINRAAAIGNSLLYYASTLPTMATDLSLIRQLMERGTTSTLPDTTAAGWTDWERQAMDNYIAIQRNTADTVVECRRAANACEASVEKLGRIITSKGSVSGVTVFMKG